MAETMIERMALTLADEIGKFGADVSAQELSAAEHVAIARAVLTAMREPIIAALKPFAHCAEELDGSQDTPRAPDGEWAKFRLLTDDYRRARDVVDMIDAALAEAG